MKDLESKSLKKHMKRSFMLILLFILYVPVYMFAQNDNSKDMYENSLQENDPVLRFQKLEEYYNKNRGDDQKIDKKFILSIVRAAFESKKFDRVIKYGEKALKFEWMNEKIKLGLYLQISNAYVISEINLTKAYNYSEFVINLGKLMIQNDSNSGLNKKFVIPALCLQIRILDKQTTDLEALENVLKKSIEAYLYKKSPEFAGYIFIFTNRLYYEFNKHDEAIEALEIVCNDSSIKPEYLNKIALWYSKNDEIEKAIGFLKRSYDLKKDAKIAYSLGKLLQRRDINEAIAHLAESYLMGDKKTSNNSEILLQHLFFNIKMDGKSSEEKERGYIEILNKARLKLGLKDN